MMSSDYGENVHFFQRDFLGRRWYPELPEVSKTSTLKKMLEFSPLSISEDILKIRRDGEVCLNSVKPIYFSDETTKRCAYFS
jgi:hypothetical protein